MRITQETAATQVGLIVVAAFGVLGFGAMGWMVDAGSRMVVLVVAAVVTALIGLYVVYLRWQSRYGTAVLVAGQPFELGRPFSGTIAVHLQREHPSTIRIRISGWRTRGEVTLARVTVDHVRLQHAADGSLLIPFTILAHDTGNLRPSEVRLHARATSWPIGWGATFLVFKADR